LSSQSLADAIRKMEASLTEKLVGFSSKKIREMSVEIKEELDTEYSYFFQFITDEVIGALSTPNLLGGYSAWKPLSAKWVKQKATSQHYVGLSNSLSRGKALGRTRKGGKEIGMSRIRANGNKPKGLVKVGAFADYIATLHGRGNTERFFGPVAIKYDFLAPDARIQVSINQDNGIVNRVRTTSVKRGQFVTFPKDMKMVANITAFGKLKGITFNEKKIVDFIIKRIDPANEKQWVKINSEIGIGRSKRPIRAIVTPILRYYMDKRLSEIVQRAIKSRRT
jgi:hypothetical protein